MKIGANLAVSNNRVFQLPLNYVIDRKEKHGWPGRGVLVKELGSPLGPNASRDVLYVHYLVQ